ncbi:MAG TPA: glycoside hydrolase family 3 C-terminal domain-containing protein [Vicinamibacterales bacterium]
MPSTSIPAMGPSAFGGLETREPLTDAQIDAIARGLLGQLRLDEKISMMHGDTHFFEGSFSARRGGYNRRPRTTAGAIPRLGIPGVRFSDGPRGYHGEGATTFPVGMARGASWDPQLEERIGDAMGREARAHGANIIGGPCINVMRHPAWGRAQEGYGEDSYHLGEMGAALVRGIQRHVMACPKHFALNSMENARFRVDVTADQRTLHEVYFPHFKRVVDEGAASIMSSYNSVNGEWSGQNKALLTGILQDEFGFQGFVQSDWVLGVRDAKKAALAGQHLEMPYRNLYYQFLRGLIDSGEVPAELVDDAALRILRQQVRFAQGRDPSDYGADVIGCEAHRQLAREAAQKNIVLLKNEGNVLPLRGVTDVTVFGRLADQANIGDRGSSMTQPAHVATPLQGLRAALGAPFRIQYEEEADPARAAAAAKFCDVAVVVVGYTWRDEGEYLGTVPGGPERAHLPKQPLTPEDATFARKFAEVSAALGSPFEGVGGDRSSLTLLPEDEALIQAVAGANPRTVVAIMAGSAVITEAWRDEVAAILMLWYPGQEGGHAFADVLLGHVNPSGRLPFVVPKSADDLPFFDKDATTATYDLWHGYRKLERDNATPAFPFGFGLSYTTFKLSDLRLAQKTIATDGSVMATAELTNTGQVAGEEVVQLYVSARSSKVERARKELKAFTKVALAPGETRTVRLAVPAASLAYYDEKNGWIVEPGDYEVIVGRHSLDDEALRARFAIQRSK